MPEWVTDDLLDVFGGRLHTIVFDRSMRRRAGAHVTHVWSGNVPKGSFYGFNDDVFVASPEFSFLGAASVLTRVQLIAYGCELCGLYSFDSRQERGFRRREVPLTTIGRIERYLDGAKKSRGYAKAVAALPHVVEKSASPMETFDEMALCLPYRLGGYGLPQPAMNYEVALSTRATRIAKRHRCFADMCYPDIKLDIEHHGKLDHSDFADQESDRARVNALKEMGYEVIELTKDQVYDLYAFECIVQRIAKLVGKRLDKGKLGAIPARVALHEEVRAWNALGGRLR